MCSSLEQIKGTSQNAHTIMHLSVVFFPGILLSWYKVAITLQGEIKKKMLLERNADNCYMNECLGVT